ncbi:XRE family transcriptional regulator [Macrococcus capreoli]|uniref:helix-turn-helix domain-containing protein n=1 Tax=Macrococcus capreoli TaxID=2982690 RepID=UPI0021D5E1FF|nr:XRE family transcriptional regulator [Macrococcus sp. TMW 2.2395]MCU7558440.1 XRE family transcriptional regulator [Macrococcus sp. TMW 2.2395]
MSIGDNIREIRKRKKMTLQKVSDKTKLSIPFLSLLETNKSDATMASIRLIADALEVHPSQFFYNQMSLSKKVVELNKGFQYERLSNELETPFVPIKVMIDPGKTKIDHVRHSGFEFVYGLKGTLTLTIDDEIVEINPGESLMYEATKAHYWYNHTNEKVEFLVVNERG